MKAESTPKLASKLPGTAQIDICNVDLFQLVQFRLDPSLDVVKAAEPPIKILLVQHFGRIDGEAMATVLMNPFALNQSVVVSGVDSDYRHEIVESSNRCCAFLVPPQDGKDADVEENVGILIGELLCSFGLPP